MIKKQIGILLKESELRADWLAQQFAQAKDESDRAFYELETCRECDHYQFLLSCAV